MHRVKSVVWRWNDDQLQQIKVSKPREEVFVLLT